MANVVGNIPKFCVNCAYFILPNGARMSDNCYRCAKGAQLSVVTGKPSYLVLKSCETERSKAGQCGPDGRLFAVSLSAADFYGVLNPTDLPIDCHGLDKPSQQDGVAPGVAIAKHGVDLGKGNAQVVADVAASE